MQDVIEEVKNTKEMKNALIAEPNRVVVVCIRGYHGFPLSLVQEQEIIAEIEREMQIEGIPKKLIKNEAKKRLQALESLDTLADSSGMKILHNRFVDSLRLYGVPESNIIYTKWTDKSTEYWKDEPEYHEIVKRINNINPIYLAILGHSYGGCTACRISRFTKVPDFVGLVDPIFIPAKLDGVRAHTAPQHSHMFNYPQGNHIVNWYQSHHWPKGFHDVYNSNGQSVWNIAMGDVSHTKIAHKKAIHDSSLNFVINGIGCSNAIDNKSILFSYKSRKNHHPYPALLATFDVRENKVTGPRVATALEKIAGEHGQARAVETSDKFKQWARSHHRHFKCSRYS